MKKNSFTQKIILFHVHHINIEVLEKTTKYLQKHVTYFQVLKLYFSNYHKFFNLIQELASTLENHDYNNLVFEVHANKS